MPSVPASADPGRDEDPAWLDRDPMTAAEREAWLDRLCAQDDDPADGPQEYWDPESCAPPPGQDELTADELAGVAAAAGDEMLALDAASTGRRGPGQAGSAPVFPGESASRAAGFGTGMAWDVMPGCAAGGGRRRHAGRRRRCGRCVRRGGRSWAARPHVRWHRAPARRPRSNPGDAVRMRIALCREFSAAHA